METKAVYTFTVTESDRTIAHSFEIDDSATWMEVARHFTDFIAGVYGYRPEPLSEISQ